MTPSRTKKRARHTEQHEEQKRPELRSIPGGRGTTEPAPIEELFGTKVTRGQTRKKGRKREIPPVALSGEEGQISDLYVAGKTILKEIQFKLDYASQRLREYCARNLIRVFSKTKKKPDSMDYQGPHSKFKFVQTRRTTLTPEKVEQLRYLKIPIDEYTELAGIDINMTEVRRHGLEEKLKEGLNRMGVAKGVMEECFTPKRELNPNFYDNLYTIIRDTLEDGEDLEKKMYETLTILNPAEQIRNVEIKDLDLEESFKLVLKTEIETEDHDSEK